MAQRGVIIGLDIGRYAVKAAWVESRSGRPVIRRLEQLRLPYEGTDPFAVIGPWLASLHIGRTPCVLGIPGTDVICQPLTLPPADPRTAEQAVDIEVIRFNEMASETMLYGFIPFEGTPGQRALQLCMARPAAVEPLLSFTKDAGLNLVDLIPMPAALHAAGASSFRESEQPVILADVGDTSTVVTIASRRGFLFGRAFAGGGRLFTEALARLNRIPPAQADSLKTSRSETTETNTPAPDLTGAIDIWVAELQSCVAVFDSLFTARDMRPGRLLLAGGSASLTGFAGQVATRMPFPVELFRDLPGYPATDQPESFAAAVGLAWTGHLPPEQRISLLPRTMRDEQVFRRQKPYWLAAAAMAGLILVATVIGGYRDIRRKQAMLGTQRAGLARRQQLAGRIEGVKFRNDQLRAMAAPVGTMLTTGARFQLLITHITGLLPADGSDWIRLIADADSYFPGRGFTPPRRRKNPDEPDVNPLRPAASDGIPSMVQTLIIEGYTRRLDFSTVRNLIVSLKTLDFVESADLLGDDRVVLPPEATRPALRPGVQRFVLEVKLR